MQESIFEDKSKVVKSSENLMSFADCPNKCIDGYYIDPYRHKRVKCVYCEEKRKELAKESIELKGGRSLKDTLNLPESFTGYGEFSIESVIPEYATKRYTEESVSAISDKLQSLIQGISVGVVPEYSLLFNLGARCFETNFIYSYLVRAYISGLIVSPYVTDYDIVVMRSASENMQDFNFDVKYQDLFKTDVCVITINAGATRNSIDAVKGIMQTRAHYNKSTIVFTNKWDNWTLNLVNEDGVESKNLATYFSIETLNKYKDKEKQYQEVKAMSKRAVTAEGISQNAFNSLMKPSNSL